MGAKKCFAVLELKKETLNPPGSSQKRKKRNLLVVPGVIGIQRKANQFGKIFGNSFGNIFGNKFGHNVGNKFGSIEKPGAKMCFRCIKIHERNIESVWHPPERIKRTLHIVPR